MLSRLHHSFSQRPSDLPIATEPGDWLHSPVAFPTSDASSFEIQYHRLEKVGKLQLGRGKYIKDVGSGVVSRAAVDKFNGLLNLIDR